MLILVNEFQSLGDKSFKWNAANNNGKTIPAGLYIYELKVGNAREIRKALLLK